MCVRERAEKEYKFQEKNKEQVQFCICSCIVRWEKAKNTKKY